MKRNEFFRVDASLMQQLGASLITDDLQALVELIKNAYDADATNVKIIIDAPDRIVVEDNGHGMDELAIERGWLTLSNSLKMQQKRQGILTTKQHRTPLGDKGLGRLSAQRLGNRLRIETTSEASDRTFAVEIDWTAFAPGAQLSSVPVTFEANDRKGRRGGTRLLITNLADPEHWCRLKNEELRLSLASLVSPYSEVASFRLQAFLNGVEVSPSLLTANIRRAAWQHLEFKFDGHFLISNGEIKPQSLRGTTKKSREDYERFFEADQGQAFIKLILSDRKSISYNIVTSRSKEHLIDFGVGREFPDIVGNRGYGNPGPFYGEVDAFSLQSSANADVMQNTDVLNSVGEARQLVKDLSGIRVYRDGFVIRTSHDWLKLGEGQTSGGSYYGLRPFNTMGFVAISASDNAKIRETTDREGFVEDSYYRGFYEILQSFIKTANDVSEHVRRSWVAFVKKQEELRHELPSRDPKVIEERLNDSFERVSDARDLLDQASKAITQSVADDPQSLFPNDPRIASAMSDVQEIISQASQTLETVGSRVGLGNLLVAELDALNARLGEVYELVSLGITAEALSHDISVILERLSVETRFVQRHVTSSNLNDIKVLRFIEIVRSTVSALERQLGHIDPALKYMRDKREVFSVSTLLADCASYYRERFAANSIGLLIEVKRDFTVSMNKGKFIQVLDNIILNSEYWVKAALAKNRSSPQIVITIDKPSVIIEDSGFGVEKAYEETLFDPFITAKPKGEGRGLGLFIATQLLELDGCRLQLLPDRNDVGRRFRIAIVLDGVAEDA